MDTILPSLDATGSHTRLLVDGRPFLIQGGELHNSSSSSAAWMEPIWKRCRALGLNTVIAPVTWELLEPEEGVYDYTHLEFLLSGAERYDLRLVLLWFGTWKNAVSSYIPAWVKTDPDRFPRVRDALGVPSNSISCLSHEAAEADAAAFSHLMTYLASHDGSRRVIMVQVENEVGSLGTARDHSPEAEAAFSGGVPRELLSALERREGAPVEREPVVNSSGTNWTEVFGESAEETFMAWHLGRYLDRVAEAGKKAYPLPLFANAWLVQHRAQRPGEYPSGGPVPHMIPVWRAAAPHLDFFAPDIYVPHFRDICRQYAIPGNPLFVPEARNDERSAAAALYVTGEHHALGFAPFAVEDMPEDSSLRPAYAMLREAAQLLTDPSLCRESIGVFQEADTERFLRRLGPYLLRLEIRNPLTAGGSAGGASPAGGAPVAGALPAGGLVIYRGDHEYLVIGRGFSVEFQRHEAGPSDTEFLLAEEGSFAAGDWVAGRRLNGDETMHGRRIKLGKEISACRVKINHAIGPLRHQENFAV